MERIDTTTSVETPERVGFRYRLAGPGQRGVAFLLDLAIQGVVLGALLFVALVLGAGGGILGGTSMGLFLLGLFGVSWFYGAVFEAAWSGRTPGKAALGLRVVRADGGPVDLRDAVLRNLLRGVDGLPVGYVVGVLVCCADPKLRRIGDLVAGTLVVHERRPDLLGTVEVDPPVSDEERLALPPRVVLSREERHAIEALLRRRPELSPARVEELAGYLAPVITERTGIEAPTALRTLTLAWARATGRER